MMHRLTKDKWKQFKQDGKLFEKLIHELLGAMYPNTDFSHTSWTHDGGKDFEGGFPFLDEKMKVWAECKYHKDPLPIHEVAMTFYMAYIESAASILFFSYSPVNREFQKYIDLYKKKSNKIIKIYADHALEELLIKYKNDFDFESYFGTLEIAETMEVHEIKYKYWLHTSAPKNRNPLKLYLNDSIILEFSAMNLGPDSIPIEIEVHYPKTGNGFLILDKQLISQNLKYSLVIPPYGINGKTIHLKLERYQSTLRLPYIKVRDNTGEKVLRIRKNPECQWLAETPVIGQKYKNVFEEWKNSFHTLQNHLGAIVGHSGTGKSRLLQEISLTAIYEGYQVIMFDADNTQSLTALYFFRKIISEIEDLPGAFHVPYKKMAYLYECLKDKKQESEFIFQIMSDDNFDFYAAKDLLVSYLLYALAQKDYALFFDNIQFYDETILEVLQCIAASVDLQSKSKLIFAANLDFTYKDTKADQIIRKIEWLAYHTPKKYMYHEVTGFKEKEAQKYLKTCLLYDDKSKTNDDFSYDHVISKIVQTYGTNPLFLQNYLLYLLQKGMITRTETSAFYISDCVGFQSSIAVVPVKLLELLSYRENAWIEYFQGTNAENKETLLKQYRLFVTFLAFAKWMPLKMIDKLTKIPSSIIHGMMHIGLLKMNEEGLYGFYHQQVELYYKNCYPYTGLPENELKKYIETALHEYNKELYWETIFLAQYELREVKPAIFKKIVNNILVQKVDYSRSYEICRSISVLLDNEIFQVPLPTFIQLYKNMANICVDRAGLLMAEKIYNSIYERFRTACLSFADRLPDAIQILQDYLRALISLHKADESLQKNNYILEVMNQHFQNHTDYSSILIGLYYLQIYANNVLNQFEPALAISDSCITLSQQIKDRKHFIQSWFTKGDIYYNYRISYPYKEHIIKCWNTAWEIYQNTKLEKESFFEETAFHLNLLMRKTLVMLFENNRKEAVQYAHQLANYFDKTKMTYFEIKIRQLYVIIFLCCSTGNLMEEEDYCKLESLLKKCIDICAVYGNETLYLDCFHLLAILQRSYGNPDFSRDNYKKCFTIAQHILEHQPSLERWSYFLFDMVIALRESNAECDIPPRIWNLISDDMVAERLYQLTVISKDELEYYLEDGQPLSLPYHPKKHIYFPKI